MGTKMKLEEIEEMMKHADPKGEGNVSIEEFAISLCPPKIIPKVGGKKKKSKK